MGVQFAGNILVQSDGGPLPISSGGTGQTTAPNAINALLPTQTGQSGKVLTTNGSSLSWSATAGGSAGGADTNIQFNDSGSFGGNAFFTVNKSTGALTSTSTFKSIGLVISDADALYRSLKYQTLGSNRWLSQVDNVTEAGANAGSDFEFVRVADNGATTNQVYTVSRATGVLDFKVAPTVNGSAINPPAAANTLTGTTLASGVVSSSLTSVGTLVNLTVTNPITGSVTGSSGSTTGNASTATTAGTVTTAAQPAITSVGTLTSLAVTGAITQNAGLSVGYLEVPQLTGTTFNLASSGKHFYNTGVATAFTIPANDTVAYPIGTAITFVNNGGTATSTIAVTTDTLLLAGTGATGTRTLNIYGFATALKITSTIWIISGTGLT